ncbi:MAG: hypothetical protein IKA18_02460, partial [Clostridia bacterium]|nr:hypothetical protein [Clostridia bacterium]
HSSQLFLHAKECAYLSTTASLRKISKRPFRTLERSDRKIAASLAFKDGLKKASPVILEPIMSIEVIVPESYTGDIMGDMNKRRGRILGIDMVNKKQVVHAEAPQSEMFKYATDLRSMTQGRGKFTMKFERYEEAPAMIIDKIVKERAALLAAEND